MTFECVYKQEVNLTSGGAFSAKSGELGGEAIGFVNLTPSLSIGLYTDVTYTVRLAKTSNLYIGALRIAFLP